MAQTMLLQRGSTAAARPVSRKSARSAVVVRASVEAELPRRAALGLLATGAAALLTRTGPAEAAYGESANVFGKVRPQTGFVSYAGEGFSLSLPASWNPSKERPFKGTLLRYEDNGDQVNIVEVISNPTDKTSIEGFGSVDKVLSTDLQYLLGKQAYQGETISEGGFAPNRVSAASLLDYSTTKDKKGKTYYNYNLLVRTADGDEGGRHRLITATVSEGKLWVLNVQVGDKRWFKGVDRAAKGVVKSFTVA